MTYPFSLRVFSTQSGISLPDLMSKIPKNCLFYQQLPIFMGNYLLEQTGKAETHLDWKRHPGSGPQAHYAPVSPGPLRILLTGIIGNPLKSDTVSVCSEESVVILDNNDICCYILQHGCQADARRTAYSFRKCFR